MGHQHWQFQYVQECASYFPLASVLSLLFEFVLCAFILGANNMFVELAPMHHVNTRNFKLSNEVD
jgi:hypothetical protein